MNNANFKEKIVFSLAILLAIAYIIWTFFALPYHKLFGPIAFCFIGWSLLISQTKTPQKYPKLAKAGAIGLIVLGVIDFFLAAGLYWGSPSIQAWCQNFFGQ